MVTELKALHSAAMISHSWNALCTRVLELHHAGWSYRSMGDAMGVTWTRVRLMAEKADRRLNP